MILPFLILSFFNHPSAEDYFFWTRTERVGFYNALLNLYKHWSGRFFSHAELLINPLIFRSFFGYKIFTLLMMLLFFFVLFKFISEFTKSDISFRERLLFSVSVFFLYCYGMPTTSEGFYWLISVPVYHNAIIFTLIFLIAYNRLIKSEKLSGRILYTVIACFSVIAIAGSNEVAMSTMILILVLIAAVNLIKERKIHWPLILIFICIGIASYIDITAPGTAVRGNSFLGKHKLVYSITWSFTVLMKNLSSYLFSTPLLPVTIILLPVLLKIIKNEENNLNIFFIVPVVSIILTILLLYSNIFTSVWSTGNTPYKRTLNLIYFEFLILWFYNVIVLLIYLNKKYEFNTVFIPKYLYIIAVLALAIYLFKNNNVKTAYSDLLRGTASDFDIKMNERYKYFQNSISDTCTVDSLAIYPKTIFAHEITSDPDIPYNQWYAKYFNKKAIILKRPE